MIHKMKHAVTNSKIWQNRCARKGFFAGSKYVRLPESEKTKRRVCYSENDILVQYGRLLDSIIIDIREGKRYQHWIDTGLYRYPHLQLNDTLPPDYSLVIYHSIDELEEKYRIGENAVCRSNRMLLAMVRRYICRVIQQIDARDARGMGDEQSEVSRRYFCNMLHASAKTLEEALQRVLFWSSLFWQTGHRHVGLGRLDFILKDAVLPETYEEQIAVIGDFYDELHRFYEYKSAQITGDTGQVIVLGGLNPDGSYFCSKLTYLFMEALRKKMLPDPKIVVRTSVGMPGELFELSLKTIETGIGCPLLSNDDVIIPSLQEFGYEKNDAYHYVTSACWEPLIYGKSWGRGNMGNVNFARIVTETYQDEAFAECADFDSVLDLYLHKLKRETEQVLLGLDEIQWEKNPLMSLFTEGCAESGKDMADGGAVYHDYGILAVGTANAVDSLMNIKKFVFDEEMYSLQELREAAIFNFEGREEMRALLEEECFFGKDQPEIFMLADCLMQCVSQICQGYRNQFGGRVKTGFSSPSYVTAGNDCGATLDGRLEGMPLSVHISPRGAAAYTQVFNFAASLDYNGNRHNGNVTDIIVSPSFMKENFAKFGQMVYAGLADGVFQMQVNVIGSRQLIDARKHPEQYPGLIVRVWGFSAYFSDLPEQYQDVLIQRTMESERAVKQYG